MSNKHYVKKKPQNKSYSPSVAGNNFLSPDESGNIDTSSFGPIYEQIKSEVVSSVLNWLSMYMAADQEDKKVTEQIIDPSHCCECTINRRIEKSNRSSIDSQFSSNLNKNGKDLRYCSLSNNISRFVDAATYTGDDDNIIKTEKICDTPEDSNMILTDFRAGQVWPDWCKYLENAVGKHSNGDLANSQVYYDKFNDRLCVYRRGLVEYPQWRQKSPRIESTSLAFKQNLKSIPEVRESLFRMSNNDKSMLLPNEYLSESNKYLLSPEFKLKHQAESLHCDAYGGLNINQIPNNTDCNNFSPNMVKWMSLPNVQFL